MSFPCIFVDYGNNRAAEHWQIVQKLAPYTVKVTYTASFSSFIASLAPKNCWVLSSHCDYTDFDLAWKPSKYDSNWVHVWHDATTKFGETFLFPESLDPWQDLEELPIKFHSDGPGLELDRISWRSTEKGTVHDMVAALGTQQARVIFQHADCDTQIDLTKLSEWSWEPKLISLEEEPCFTYASDAAWLRDQALLVNDMAMIDQRIIVPCATRRRTHQDDLPLIRVTGSNVLNWLDHATRLADGWVVVAHTNASVADMNLIWDHIYSNYSPTKLHAFGGECALVLAVNAKEWRARRFEINSIYDWPELVIHEYDVRVNPLNAMFVNIKDWVNDYAWTPANWDDMRGPVALTNKETLLGVAGDETLINELLLSEPDPWQWPELRVVQVNARVLKRNIINVKR